MTGKSSNGYFNPGMTNFSRKSDTAIRWKTKLKRKILPLVRLSVTGDTVEEVVQADLVCGRVKILNLASVKQVQWHLPQGVVVKVK